MCFVLRRLKWAGLLPFARLVEATDTNTHVAIDHALLTCLTDRWRPETHTFHFRWGEMAPTLEDVSLLLGLPLSGHAIGPLEAPAGWEQQLGNRFQNIYPGAPALAAEKHGPKFDWLGNFEVCSSITDLSFVFHLPLVLHILYLLIVHLYLLTTDPEVSGSHDCGTDH